jgi:hypothetical protein
MARPLPSPPISPDIRTLVARFRIADAFAANDLRQFENIKRHWMIVKPGVLIVSEFRSILGQNGSNSETEH